MLNSCLIVSPRTSEVIMFDWTQRVLLPPTPSTHSLWADNRIRKRWSLESGPSSQPRAAVPACRQPGSMCRSSHERRFLQLLLTPLWLVHTTLNTAFAQEILLSSSARWTFLSVKLNEWIQIININCSPIVQKTGSLQSQLAAWACLSDSHCS